MTKEAALKAWETRRANAAKRSEAAKKAWTTRRRRANGIQASQVIAAITEAETSGQKAAATKLLNRYVEQQEEMGHQASRVRGAIQAHVTRLSA